MNQLISLSTQREIELIEDLMTELSNINSTPLLSEYDPVINSEGYVSWTG